MIQEPARSMAVIEKEKPVAGGAAEDLISSCDLGATQLPFLKAHRETEASSCVAVNGGGGGDGFKKEMRDLEELLSKLNPMAEEFVPPSLNSSGSYSEGFFHGGRNGEGIPGVYANGFGLNNGGFARKKKGGFSNQGIQRRMNNRTSMAQREDAIRRTVYVSDIDNQVTEEQLAALFINCGQVVDCRVCGDPKSVLRFAFIEFTDEEGARAALSLAGTMLGYYPVKVLPSKTAIAPVNPTFLPRSDDEREMCARTVYCTNIDKKITQEELRLFFGSICGEVYRMRMLGDYQHNARIAFVEFVMEPDLIIDWKRCTFDANYFHLAWDIMNQQVHVSFSGEDVNQISIPENRFKILQPVRSIVLTQTGAASKMHQAESATAALNCSGVVLGSLPIRVSPSKTPVRPRGPRQPMH